MSHVTCPFFLDKVVKLIGGGSVINGAYPVQFKVRFKHFFAPTSKSICKNFKYSEFFGKSNGKKQSQVGKVLLGKGLKSLHNFCICFLLLYPCKAWRKPRFPMDQRPVVKGRNANFGKSLDIFLCVFFKDFFC